MPGVATSPATEAVSTMAPRFCCSITGRTRRSPFGLRRQETRILAQFGVRDEGVSSIEPDCSGGEMDGGGEISCGFVVAGGDGPELLEFAEEIFDQVSCLVEFLIERARRFGFAWAGSRLISRRSPGRRMTRSSASKALSAIRTSAAICGSNASAPTRSWT